MKDTVVICECHRNSIYDDTDEHYQIVGKPTPKKDGDE